MASPGKKDLKLVVLFCIFPLSALFIYFSYDRPPLSLVLLTVRNHILLCGSLFWRYLYNNQEIMTFFKKQRLADSLSADQFLPGPPFSIFTDSHLQGLWDLLWITPRALQPCPPPPAAARRDVVRKQRGSHRAPLPAHQRERWRPPRPDSRPLCRWAGASQENISEGLSCTFRSRRHKFPLQSWN